jgi:hypothetical protein
LLSGAWRKSSRLGQRRRAGAIEGRFDMTDLGRLGLALVGFAVAVVGGGVLLGLIGAWLKRR